MGVPSFYRWLVIKYPKIMRDAVEEPNSSCVDDASHQQNPNGVEFDNLYLDMNGIIHPCFHPDDQLMGPTTYDEVFASIFEYIDRIFRIVRPRKLLYLAIDGVAPRAKMNRQRSGRFRTAMEAELAEAEEERLRKEFQREGKVVLPKEESEVSDSNVITPGTVFMEKLSKALEYYVRLGLNSDPGWKSIKVIISDANVPGEAEHKIMSFIRLQRKSPEYNPKTCHCLYGLDADLIMLALATHEIHFFILREDVMKREHGTATDMASLSTNLSKMELNMVKSRQWFSKVFEANSNIPKKLYQFVNIWILREYLELDLKMPDVPFVIDFERIVDDFVFICFFTGNDFLPHMPTLDIHEGAIDLLIAVYKKVFKSNGGYLVDTNRIKEKKAAYMNVKRVERFILEVGKYEDKIFSKRYNIREAYKKRLLNQRLEEENRGDDFDKPNQYKVEHRDSDTPSNLRDSDTISGRKNVESLNTDVHENTRELKRKLKDYLRNNGDLFKNGFFETDKVKLGCDGWKARYYREKFSTENPSEIESKRKEIVDKYIEGLCWVLRYYYAGVCSWSWYYPYYYGPFASDLRGLVLPRNEFELGEPFKPYNQLMAVLPPRSSNALPKVYKNLMHSEDSPLIKFYPQGFEIDVDGKRFAWQGVCKLPFIDEGILIAATKKLEKDLEINEADRNSIKHNMIFVRECDALGSIIASLKDSSERKAIDANSCKINGYISQSVGSSRKFASPVRGMNENNVEDLVLSAVFVEPNDDDNDSPRLLVTQLPEKTITESDLMERQLWHESWGSRPHVSTNQ